MLSGLTAAWFALMAYKLQKGLVLWCIGGAVLALCIGGICLGLAHAVTLPYSPSDFRRMQSIAITVAVFLIGITGAIIGVANRSPVRSP